MAYFECIIGSGGSGTAIPLTVVCSSGFAGGTITCTDGTTTLTGTCPSSSPYILVFDLPNAGTWTVSGDVSGTTYTKSVTVNSYDVDLKNYITKTVTVYSAASDTVSYTGLDGATHTITTNSSGSATASITIKSTGSTFTFTSSVAKNPSDLSSNYTKSITITNSTSTIYVMPTSGSKMLYWYGYRGTQLETMSTANGWTAMTGYSFVNPTYQTNAVYINADASKQSGIGSIIQLDITTAHAVVKVTKNSTYLTARLTKSVQGTSHGGITVNTLNTVEHAQFDASPEGDAYLMVSNNNGRTSYVYGLWVE